jgi:tetratricopeptide (TPR) repeat protein
METDVRTECLPWSATLLVCAWMASVAVGQDPDLGWLASYAHRSALNEATSLLADGQFEAAIHVCNGILARDPDCVEAYVRRYFAYMGVNRFDRALADSEEILKREPRHRGALSVRATVLVREARYEEALRAYTRIIEIEPEDSMAYAQRAAVWFRMGKWKEACADFDRALKVGPHNAAVYGTRADCRRLRGDLAGAAADYEAAVKADDNFLTAHLGLARILSRAEDDKLRNGKRALDHARRAVELTGGRDYNALDALVSAYAELGQFAKAVEVTKKALDLAQRGAYADYQAIRGRLELYQAGRPCRE